MIEENEKLKNYFNYLKSLPETKYFPLDVINRKISNLLVLSQTINSNPDKLETSYKKAIEDSGQNNYALPLIDYILLEIRAFYSQAYFILQDECPTPTHYDLVKNFRNEIIAHLPEKRITQKEIVEKYEEINKIGIKKIYADWINFRDEVYHKIDMREEIQKQNKL